MDTDAPLHRLRRLRLLVFACLAVLAAILGFQRLQTPSTSAQDVSELVGQRLIEGLGPVAEFELTDQDGLPFKRSDLQGKIWVVDFVFTRCSGPCAKMTERMRTISNHLKDEPDVGFLSFSVDPEFDTPEILSGYARRYRADTTRWKFLTGDKDEIFELATKSFFVTVEDPEAGSNQVIHSERFVVLDGEGFVRAFHHAQIDGEGQVTLGVAGSVKILKETLKETLKESLKGS
jgi:protein SCO1/2